MIFRRGAFDNRFRDNSCLVSSAVETRGDGQGLVSSPIDSDRNSTPAGTLRVGLLPNFSRAPFP